MSCESSAGETYVQMTRMLKKKVQMENSLFIQKKIRWADKLIYSTTVSRFLMWCPQREYQVIWLDVYSIIKPGKIERNQSTHTHMHTRNIYDFILKINNFTQNRTCSNVAEYKTNEKQLR